MIDSEATWAPALPVWLSTAPVVRSTTLMNEVTPFAEAFPTADATAWAGVWADAVGLATTSAVADRMPTTANRSALRMIPLESLRQLRRRN